MQHPDRSAAANLRAPAAAACGGLRPNRPRAELGSSISVGSVAEPGNRRFEAGSEPLNVIRSESFCFGV
jgi:hypothetical protein